MRLEVSKNGEHNKRIGKGMVSFLLVFVLICGLCSCVYSQYDFEDIVEEDVQFIQFYDISGEESRDSETVLSTEPFYTLPVEKHAEFFKELRKIEFGDGFPLFAPSDPSFSYGEYVVRINFKDGSYKLLSCGGYNELFDIHGKRMAGDHYSCDNTEWNDFIYSFVGERSSRLYYHSTEVVISVDDHVRLNKILHSAKYMPNAPNCFFASDDYIKAGGKTYYLAENNQAIIRLNDTFFEITEQEKEELYSIIIKYISFWRYNEFPS